MERHLRLTADRSPTFYVPALDQHYHSRHGALQESRHVFIQSGLQHLATLPEVQLLEIGWGTGLNALLSAQYAQEHQQVLHYHGVEKYPLLPQEWASLHFPEAGTPEQLEALHTSPEDEWRPLHSHFHFRKSSADLRDLQLRPQDYHLIYYDAFAPEAQPELWTPAIFAKLYQSLRPDGLLVTYSVKGSVKRALRSAGFQVQKLPGPPGKREICRARRPNEHSVSSSVPSSEAAAG